MTIQQDKELFTAKREYEKIKLQINSQYKILNETIDHQKSTLLNELLTIYNQQITEIRKESDKLPKFVYSANANFDKIVRQFSKNMTAGVNDSAISVVGASGDKNIDNISVVSETAASGLEDTKKAAESDNSCQNIFGKLDLKYEKRAHKKGIRATFKESCIQTEKLLTISIHPSLKPKEVLEKDSLEDDEIKLMSHSQKTETYLPFYRRWF